MTDQIIIKKEDGKSINVTASQSDDGIVLTKTGDRTEDFYKRKIIMEAMDFEVYKQFISINVQESYSEKILGYLRHLTK